MRAVETCDLGKRYGKLWALAECSLALDPAQIVGLVGPNGAGKTTLMHLLVGLLAPTAVVLFGALALGLTWWNHPVSPIIGPWLLFDNNGVVLVSHALFGLALGVALGALIGKVVPAMALTIPLFIAMRLALVLLRPHYLPSEQLVWDFNSPSPQTPHMLIVSMRLVNRGGLALTSEEVTRDCPFTLIDIGNPYRSLDAQLACYRDRGFQQALHYQPAERFWLLQGIESTIFLLLAAGFSALAAESLRANKDKTVS